MARGRAITHAAEAERETLLPAYLLASRGEHAKAVALIIDRHRGGIPMDPTAVGGIGPLIFDQNASPSMEKRARSLANLYVSLYQGDASKMGAFLAPLAGTPGYEITSAAIGDAMMQYQVSASPARKLPQRAKGL